MFDVEIDGTLWSSEPIEEHNGRVVVSARHLNQKIRRARKRYGCDACCEDIPKGTYHVAFTTEPLEGPGIETFRQHGECRLEDSGGTMWECPRPLWRWVPDWFQNCDTCEHPVDPRIKKDRVRFVAVCPPSDGKGDRWNAYDNFLCLPCAEGNGIREDQHVDLEDILEISRNIKTTGGM